MRMVFLRVLFIVLFILPACSSALYSQSILEATKEGDLEKIKSLVHEDTNTIDSIDKYGRTPLHLAVQYGHYEIVKYLLSKGANPDVQHRYGSTPLYLSVRYASPEIAELLLEHDAKVELANQFFGTPLHRAVRDSRIEIINLFIQEQVNLDVIDGGGRTPLHVAAQAGDSEIAELLLENGADLKLRDYVGDTPLHLAAAAGYSDIIKLLLQYEPELNPTNHDGFTPLDYSLKYGNGRIAAVLTKHGAGRDSSKRFPVFSDYQNRELDTGEALIWYLGHSGWAVKTKNNLLIFDYWEDRKKPDNPSLLNGFINPSELRDLNVYIFVSHKHHDHYDSVIFSWEDKLPKTNYIFGWDREKAKQYFSLDGTRDDLSVGDLEIHTINAIDGGKAFLVAVDGITLYHGGDYLGEVESDMSYLASLSNSLDIAFIESGFVECAEETIGKLQPKVMFPMHFGMREYNFADFRETSAPKFRNMTFVYAQHRGDSYVYVKGKIMPSAQQ